MFWFSETRSERYGRPTSKVALFRQRDPQVGVMPPKLVCQGGIVGSSGVDGRQFLLQARGRVKRRMSQQD